MPSPDRMRSAPPSAVRSGVPHARNGDQRVGFADRNVVVDERDQSRPRDCGPSGKRDEVAHPVLSGKPHPGVVEVTRRCSVFEPLEHIRVAVDVDERRSHRHRGKNALLSYWPSR